MERDTKNEWTRGDTLHKEFEFDDFKEALAFVNKVGLIAEEENHHPEICFTWGKVKIDLTTHDAGGVTEKDFSLAKRIDEI